MLRGDNHNLKDGVYGGCGVNQSALLWPRKLAGNVRREYKSILKKTRDPMPPRGYEFLWIKASGEPFVGSNYRSAFA